MTFEQVLKEIGEFGLFQKILVFFFLQISMDMLATQYWIQVYILLTPPHRCKIGYDDEAWSLRNSTNSGINESSECHLNIVHSTEYRNNSERKPCPYGWVYDYSDLYPTFTSQNDWVCDNSWRVYTAHTCYWTGGAIGFLIFGSLSDKIGRKRSIIYFASIMLLADIGTYFATNFTTFLIARIFSAIGEANLATCIFVLAIEYTAPKYRVICQVVMSLSYTFIPTVTPWIVFALADWHHIISFAWILTSLSIIITSFMPESASWLMTRGRTEEAVRCIQRVARINGRQLTLQRIKEILLEKESNSASDDKLLVNDTKSQEHAEYEKISFFQATVGLIKTPNMRKKTILLITLWMIVSTCYVGCSLETANLPWSFRLKYSVGGISELPSFIICLLALDIIGRRWVIISLLFIGGSFGMIAGAFTQNSTTILLLAFIMRTGYVASYDTTFTLASELFPTVVRGRGITIVRIFGGLASAVAPFIFALSEHDKLLPLAVFGILCISGGIVTLFLPETAKHDLPHTLEEAEYFGKGQSFFYCPFSQRKRSAERISRDMENMTLK